MGQPPRNGLRPVATAQGTGVAVLGLSFLTESGFKPCQTKPVPIEYGGIRDAFLHEGDLLISRSNTFERVGLVGTY